MNLLGLLFPLKEHPLKMGARLATEELTRNKPFGTAMVGIGGRGVPDDVYVFPISRYARERGTSESEVRAGLEAKGYSLFSPETFFAFLDRLKHGILQGTSRLPSSKFGTVFKLVRRRS